MYVDIPAPWFAYGDINWDRYITVMAQLIVAVYGFIKFIIIYNLSFFGVRKSPLMSIKMTVERHD